MNILNTVPHIEQAKFVLTQGDRGIFWWTTVPSLEQAEKELARTVEQLSVDVVAERRRIFLKEEQQGFKQMQKELGVERAFTPEGLAAMKAKRKSKKQARRQRDKVQVGPAETSYEVAA